MKAGIRRTLELLLAQCVLILIKIKELLWDGIRRGFVLWVMVGFQVRVTQCFFNCDSLDRVKGKKFFQ